MATRSVTNTVQNTASHKGLDLEEADGGNLDSPSGRADGGDPFPGSSNAHSFTSLTSPNSNSYNGQSSGVSLTNIAEAGGVVTLDVTIGAGGAPVAYWGDVTGDGAVTVADAQAMYDELVGNPSGYAMTYADVDGNGRFDARDALITHSYVVGGIDVSQFRVGQPVTQGVHPQPLAAHTPPRSRGAGRAIPVKPLSSASRAAATRTTQRDR
jgi:hypothetical protein